jgi:hypothetical protein
VSHEHKVGFSDELDAAIRRVAEDRRLPSYNDAVRLLVVLGLAAEWDRTHRPPSSSNPFLYPDTNLLEK